VQPICAGSAAAEAMEGSSGGCGCALPCGAGADGDADRAAADAVVRLRGVGGDGVAANHAAGDQGSVIGEQQQYLCAAEWRPLCNRLLLWLPSWNTR
jgi:hypothetical protein